MTVQQKADRSLLWGAIGFRKSGCIYSPHFTYEFRIGEIRTESAPPNTPSGEALE
jgi:hypothetical protein